VKATTKQKWAERVRAWRASGQEAGAFAAGKGFAGSTLRWWASQVEREVSPPRIVPVVARAASQRARGDLVIEVGAARVRVTPGFDGALLAEVVRALGGER
jgi:hypothetical protein